MSLHKNKILVGYVSYRTCKGEVMSWANIIAGPQAHTVQFGVVREHMTPPRAAALSVLMLLKRLNQPTTLEIRFDSYYIQQIHRMLHYWKQQPNAWMKQNYEDRSILEPVPNADIWREVTCIIDNLKLEITWIYTRGHETEHISAFGDTYSTTYSDPVEAHQLDEKTKKLAYKTLADFQANRLVVPADEPVEIKGYSAKKTLNEDSINLTPPPWFEFAPR
jgi:hypothetical protein